MIEALFDDIASRAGMQNMRNIMQSSDPVRMLREYLQLMVNLWSEDRVLIRCIHALRAVDPELGAALNARDQRKKTVLGKSLEVLETKRGSALVEEERQYHLSILYAFTSFEVYEILAESFRSQQAVTEAVLRAVGRALGLDLLGAR